MPSWAVSWLFIISECHWALARGSLADAISHCRRSSPGVLLGLQKGRLLWTGVCPPLIPPFLPDIPDWFFYFFEGLNGVYLCSDRNNSGAHTSTLSLSVPPLSSSRLQHPGVKMNASHKKMWFEMHYGKNKYEGEKKYYFVFVLFFQFPQSYLKFWQWFHNKEVLAVMTTALERW